MSSEQQVKAPRRNLQVPRPAPPKICRDSHNIRKPQQPMTVGAMQYRKPVIIYTHDSPDVIHTDAREFMMLVQTLTGRANAHADSTMRSSSSIQSQTCHALPHSHTSAPVNPNSSRADASSSPPPGGLGEKFIDRVSSPSVFPRL